MNQLLFSLILSTVELSEPASVSQKATYSSSIEISPNKISHPADNPETVTKPTQTPISLSYEDLQPRFPVDIVIGVQEWGTDYNFGIGFSKGIHEVRLLAPYTGIYLDYKRELGHIRALHFNAGGMAGIGPLVGGHIGLKYRTGGDSFWGRTALGLDTGMSCSEVNRVYECKRSGGLNSGHYFAPSDIGL